MTTRLLGRTLCAPLVVLAVAATPVRAQTNWNVTGGGSWNEPTNWSSGVPTISTTAIFGPNPTAAATVDLNGAAAALGIQVTNPGGALTINNGTGTNTLTLGAGGIDMTNAATQNLTINATTVAVDAAQLWDVRQGRVLTVSSGINLGANTLTLNTATGGGVRADINLNGPITGTGGLTANGNGQVTLNPSTSNNFSGELNVNGGLVVLRKTASAGSTVVNLNDGHLRFGVGAFDTIIDNPLPAGTALSLTGTASYNIASMNAAGTLSFASTGTGHNQTYSSVNYASTNEFQTGVTLATITVTGTFTHAGTTTTGRLVIRDRATLSVGTLDMSTGTGQVFLGGASGVSQSRLVIGSGGWIMNSRTIQMNQANSATGVGSRIELNGPVTVNTGASFIVLNDAVNLRPAEIQLRDPARVFSINGTSALTVATQFTDGTGSGGILKQGSGTLEFGGTATFPRAMQSTYTGTTQIDGGAIRTNNPNVLSTSSAVVIGNSGALILQGNSQTIASLAGAGIVDMGAGTLTTGGSNASTTYSGIVNGSGGGLTKIGSGTFTLAGSTGYTGATTINGGTLSVAAGTFLNAASAVAVNNTGTFEGAGTANGSVTVNTGGTISGGVSGVGTLTIGGDLTFNTSAGQDFRITAAGSPAAPNSGGSSIGAPPNPSNNNFVNVLGTLTLGGDPATYQFFIDGTGSTFDPLQSYSYQVGSAAAGSAFTINNQAQFTTAGISDPFIFSISSNGPGPIYLNMVSPVPEPATVLGLSAGALALGGLIRRRVRGQTARV